MSTVVISTIIPTCDESALLILFVTYILLLLQTDFNILCTACSLAGLMESQCLACSSAQSYILNGDATEWEWLWMRR